MNTLRLLNMSLLCVTFTLMLCGCETGNLISGYEIAGIPDRIVYIANVDTELDLKGLKTIIHYKDGSIIEEPLGLITNSMGSSGHKIHNIDFKKPGVYEVDLSFDWRYIGGMFEKSEDKKLSYRFFVQVVDDNTYDLIIKNNKTK